MTEIDLAQIVRLDDTTEYGLMRRNIYGLNILYANGVEVKTQNDPRITFLRQLSARTPCAACVGYLSLKEMVNNPAEMFGVIGGEMAFIRLPVGLYGGTFYDLMKYPTQDACYFPYITSGFWEAKTEYDDIRSIFDNDAVALFVGVNDTHKVEHSLTSFTSEDILQQELAAECRLVVTSGGDGSALSVYTSKAKFFSDLNQPLIDAIKMVTDNEWYSYNKNSLVWNSDGDECLMLL